MGYYSLIASCFGCGKVFASNPDHVPSYQNQPVCEDCINRANPQRIANGLDPIVIHPMAYQPAEEGAL